VSRPRLPASLGALAEPQFRLYFIGRTVSMLGAAISPVALAFAVLHLTGSASDLGIVFAARTIPSVLFLLVGGVLADRLPRHHVMVVSSVFQGLSQAVLAVLLLTGSAEIWHIVALAAVHGAAGAFFMPASQGIVPQVVSRSRLQEANALLRLSRNATSVGGAALGGILVATVGAGWAIGIDAASFGISALVLLRLAIPAALRIEAPNFWRELHEGWRQFSSRTWVWVIVLAFGFINAFWTASYLVLGPVIAERDLGGAASWGFILSAASAGFFLGAVVSLRVRPRYPMRAGMLGIFGMVPTLVLLAVGAPTVVIALAAAVGGFGIEIFGVQWETALQQHVPNEALARVSAYDGLGSIVLMPIGYAVVGPVSETYGAEATLWGSAVFLVVLTALTLVSRDVRNLPRLDEVSAAPAQVALEPGEPFVPLGADGGDPRDGVR
jgi:MFS family permease